MKDRKIHCESNLPSKIEKDLMICLYVGLE